jgi:hypothetical protein
LTPEEVAAVTAVAVALRRREDEAAASSAAAASGSANAQLSAWVDASRRSAQRALMQRGPWRLSNRIGRRSRT